MDSNTKNLELRKVQATHQRANFVLSLPKIFVQDLGVEKGDYVKCWMANNRLLVEKANI